MPTKKPAKKNPAAVALVRIGGQKRAEKLSADELAEIGRKGARKRWEKTKAAPEAARPKSKRSSSD